MFGSVDTAESLLELLLVLCQVSCNGVADARCRRVYGEFAHGCSLISLCTQNLAAYNIARLYARWAICMITWDCTSTVTVPSCELKQEPRPLQSAQTSWRP